MLAIVIITYNNHNLLIVQAELIKKFCTDEYEIVVVDNSDKKEAIDAIKYVATDLNKFRYIKTRSSSSNGSDSHAFAANLSFLLLKNDYSSFFYLDHDCFPVKSFSVKDIMSNYLIAGVGQAKKKLYMWPGCLMFKNTAEVKKMIDFSVNQELGLDTGGNLYKVIEKVGMDNALFFEEVYEENKEFTKGEYRHYSMLCNETFMHFINGSGWNPSESNDERINSLFNTLNAKTCAAQ